MDDGFLTQGLGLDDGDTEPSSSPEIDTDEMGLEMMVDPVVDAIDGGDRAAIRSALLDFARALRDSMR